MLAYNGMLIGTGTAYKLHTATQRKRDGAPTEQHTCPSRAEKRSRYCDKDPRISACQSRTLVPACMEKKDRQ